MATWLRQSTAVDIPIGPFVDNTDGFTPETGLTITQPDIRLKKNGVAWGQKNAAQTLTHEENGWYEIALDTTDTNTLGIMVVAIYELGALAAWREFLVIASNVYDSIVGGGDVLDISLVQWLGTAPNVLIAGRTDASAGALAADVITAASIAAGAIGSSEAPLLANLDATVSSRATAVGVRDVALAGSAAGSLGESLRVLLGTTGKSNFRLDNMVYNGNGFMTSARLRVFPDSATATASTAGGTGQGEIATVTLTATPDGTFNTQPTTVLGLKP